MAKQIPISVPLWGEGEAQQKQKIEKETPGIAEAMSARLNLSVAGY